MRPTSHVKKRMDLNIENHLSLTERMNLGSYYTPSKYVNLVAEWLGDLDIPRDSVIADLSCGYGAFFALHEFFPQCRYLGNDIDPKAIAQAKAYFPFIHAFQRNILKGVSRKNFGLMPKELLVIVGNPPYNDRTSIVGRTKKLGRCDMDAALYTRDLGMSSLLAYNKLKAEYVAVLHPLSYLLKETNFRCCAAFFRNYELLEHQIFSSQEFAGTSRLAAFPVIVALYHRQPKCGLSYQDVQKMLFHTVEGKNFRLSQRDFITAYIRKYPHKQRFTPELLFYTQRDVNALKRNRTFLKTRIPNAVDIAPEQLPYYCYLDCFRQFAQVPYWMGNFDVPLILAEFPALAEDFIAVAKYAHPDIFGKCPAPGKACQKRVQDYIRRVVDFGTT